MTCGLPDSIIHISYLNILQCHESEFHYQLYIALSLSLGDNKSNYIVQKTHTTLTSDLTYSQRHSNRATEKVKANDYSTAIPTTAFGLLDIQMPHFFHSSLERTESVTRLIMEKHNNLS